MAPQPQIETFTGTRISLTSPNDFKSTMQKLYSEIGTPDKLAWPSAAKGITSYDESNKQKFIAQTEKAIGSKGFMIFLVPSPQPCFSE